MQDKIKFSLIMSYNAAFIQKIAGNKKPPRGIVDIRQQILCMLTDGRGQIKQATKLVLDPVTINANKLR
jgi:hypothetical protein